MFFYSFQFWVNSLAFTSCFLSKSPLSSLSTLIGACRIHAKTFCPTVTCLSFVFHPQCSLLWKRVSSDSLHCTIEVQVCSCILTSNPCIIAYAQSAFCSSLHISGFYCRLFLIYFFYVACSQMWRLLLWEVPYPFSNIGWLMCCFEFCLLAQLYIQCACCPVILFACTFLYVNFCSEPMVLFACLTSCVIYCRQRCYSAL